jgi:hypothetical protein
MTTLTQQFRTEYAKGVVPAMLKSIKAAYRDTRIIVAGVLTITYPHQALFLSHVKGVSFLGWIIPLVIDLALLRLVGLMQTVGMCQPAKTAAKRMVVFLGLISATINVAAPAAVAARALFGVLVVVAVGMKVVTSKIGPDFAEIEAQETAVAVAPVEVAQMLAGCTHPTACSTGRQCASKTATAATRKANVQRLADEKAAAAEARREAREAKRLAAKADAAELWARIAVENDPGYVDSVAPVSPAAVSA